MNNIKDNKKIKISVSVCIITYNHEKYIAQAIKGALSQKVDNYNYEIVIGEDCSTDKTREIIMKYQKENPDKIKIIYNEKNLGMMDNFINTLNSCTGKYIALCEGDDYWTDPYKLQKQVDFLEENPDFSICHHNMQVIYDDGRKPCLSNSSSQKEVTTIEDLAKGNYIYTASCVFRNGLIKEFPKWFKNAPIGDYPLHMLNAQYGKIRYLPDVMGVYRIHKDGILSNKNSIYRTETWIKLIDLMKNYFNPKINEILSNTQINCLGYHYFYKKDYKLSRKYFIQSIFLKEAGFEQKIKSSAYIVLSFYPNLEHFLKNIYFKIKHIINT